MHRACALVAAVLARLQGAAAPGVSTAELDGMAEEQIRAAGGTPAFKGTTGTPRRFASRSTTR